MSRKYSDVYQVKSPTRTEGDGMENTDETNVTEDVNKVEVQKHLRDQYIYHPVDLNQHIAKTDPNFPSNIVNLTPKSITKSIPKLRKGKTSLNFGKEPKFVPYEPYKAAVKPIIPFEKEKHKKRNLIRVHASRKSNEETEKLNNEFHKMKVGEAEDDSAENAENKTENEDWVVEKKQMERELKQLKEENAALENQVKFQTQVNGELKKLLVAAVGEDIETRVHFLTEDKLQLARALLTSAHSLSTHQEQIEWLAGQCEVWRSKFLASSLMVEELAKWKASLNQKVSTYEDIIRQLRRERNSVRESSLQTFRNLHVLQNNYDLAALVNSPNSRESCLPKTSNILDLASTNLKISENLKLQLLGVEASKYKTVNLNGLCPETAAEQLSNQAMSVPLELLERTDDACSAVIGAAVALNATIHNPNCHHCTGKVQVL